ncbi:TerB family tellurite resistance protein [Aliarcobacter butzleri]|uniref:TerB family tellurite resistance protein n=1 Tax=Aliarcobacter butzleri TaxID=28197 RepID=UPI00125FADD2|nr:TerB family tellurite resistance protein [Aliarcobacter butzleri]MCT7562169.1 TerB family tellurite resistance protein [Aliarcobacter butzleri]
MYLNYLEENEKKAFLKLAHMIANSDDEFCDNERIIINSYCNEMGIRDIEFDKNELIDIVAYQFKTDQSRRIVIFELMNIINANGEFKDNERAIIDVLLKEFNIEEKFLNDVKQWSDSMSHLVEQGYKLVISFGTDNDIK